MVEGGRLLQEGADEVVGDGMHDDLLANHCGGLCLCAVGGAKRCGDGGVSFVAEAAGLRVCRARPSPVDRQRWEQWRSLSGRERKYGDVFSQSSSSFVLVLGSRKKGNSRTKDEDDDERKIHHSICGPDH